MSRSNRSVGGSSRRPLALPKSMSGVGVGGGKNGPSPSPALRKASGPKTQRTSKTSQKLVVLPSAPQTKPLVGDDDEDLTFGGYETDGGIREHKSDAERMSKEQRKRAGYGRITAYCVADALRMKLLTSFLKREHNVHPRVFDEALYVMYHLPLLPGYAHSNIRSSAPAKGVLVRLEEAEERGYQGTYFTKSPAHSPPMDGYISSNSPVDTRTPYHPFSPTTPEDERGGATEPETEAETTEAETETETETGRKVPRRPPSLTRHSASTADDPVAEVVFFEYGVVVFFGLDEGQEKSIVEDLEHAKILLKKIPEDDWEVEECHYAHDPHISYPRIYNDFFTLKSRSHLLKLSIAHALAQSTLLAHYETNTTRVLSSPLTLAIPTQLASSGALQLRRHEALKLTGRLFKLRKDVNLVSNVLDVPELFWSEASLKSLYDAVREYMEISERVQVLNEKLGVASDFLDAIHDHLNNNAMERITRIIIWLIVAAILVELGEVIARLIVHATTKSAASAAASAAAVIPIQREDALRTLERMMLAGSAP